MTAQKTYSITVHDYELSTDSFNCEITEDGVTTKEVIPASAFSEADEAARAAHQISNTFEADMKTLTLAALFECYYDEEPTDLCNKTYDLY